MMADGDDGILYIEAEEAVIVCSNSFLHLINYTQHNMTTSASLIETFSELLDDFESLRRDDVDDDVDRVDLAVRCPKCNTVHPYAPATNITASDNLHPVQVFCSSASATYCVQCGSARSNGDDGVFSLPFCGHLVCRACVNHHSFIRGKAKEKSPITGTTPAITSTVLECKQCAQQDDPTRHVEKRYSHGARLVQMMTTMNNHDEDNSEICPICLEEQDSTMVTLACGHLICQKDFENLGGKIGDAAVWTLEEMAQRLRRRRLDSISAQSLRARMRINVTALIQLLVDSTNEHILEAAEMAVAMLKVAVSFMMENNGDGQVFLSAGGLVALVKAFQCFPQSFHILPYGCMILERLCCFEDQAEEDVQRNARTIIDTPGMVDALINGGLKNQAASVHLVMLVCNTLGTLVRDNMTEPQQFDLIARAAVMVVVKLHPNKPRVVTCAMDMLASLLVFTEDGPSEEHDGLVFGINVPYAVAKIMRRFPNVAIVQESGIRALTHASFGPLGAAEVRRVGGIALTFQAMKRFPSSQIVQLDSFKFICIVSNYQAAEPMMHEAAACIRMCMDRYPLDEIIQALACTALQSLASNFGDSMAFSIAGEGCVHAIANALGNFKGLENTFVALHAADAILSLAVSSNCDMRSALTTTNIIPALEEIIANTCSQYWIASALGCRPNASPKHVRDIENMANKTFGLLGVLDILGDGVDGPDFDDVDEDFYCPIQDPPFTVSQILDTDLSSAGGDSVPGWYQFRPFFVDVERSRQLAIQHDKDFLLPMEAPHIGTNVCIRVALPFGGRGHLHGVITNIHSEVFLPRTNNEESASTRKEMQAGQRAATATVLTATVSLASPFLERKLRYRPLVTYFHGEGSRYETTLRCNWHANVGAWKVTRISSLSG